MEFIFEKLEAWKISMELVNLIYEVTAKFPDKENYGLISQIRRSAVSIPANIAEGKGRNSDKEFKQFLYISRGSLYETITLLKIAKDQSFLKEKDYECIMIFLRQVQSKLSGLINYLK